MPNPHYDRGADFEREIKKDLIGKGWAAVRSAGSHGDIDVLAYHMGVALFVSCRKHGVLSPAERRALVRLADGHNAIPLLADKRKRGVIAYRRPAQDGKYEPFDPGVIPAWDGIPEASPQLKRAIRAGMRL